MIYLQTFPGTRQVTKNVNNRSLAIRFDPNGEVFFYALECRQWVSAKQIRKSHLPRLTLATNNPGHPSQSTVNDNFPMRILEHLPYFNKNGTVEDIPNLDLSTQQKISFKGVSEFSYLDLFSQQFNKFAECTNRGNWEKSCITVDECQKLNINLEPLKAAPIKKPVQRKKAISLLDQMCWKISAPALTLSSLVVGSSQPIERLPEKESPILNKRFAKLQIKNSAQENSRSQKNSNQPTLENSRSQKNSNQPTLGDSSTSKRFAENIQQSESEIEPIIKVITLPSAASLITESPLEQNKVFEVMPYPFLEKQNLVREFFSSEEGFAPIEGVDTPFVAVILKEVDKSLNLAEPNSNQNFDGKVLAQDANASLNDIGKESLDFTKITSSPLLILPIQSTVIEVPVLKEPTVEATLSIPLTHLESYDALLMQERIIQNQTASSERIFLATLASKERVQLKKLKKNKQECLRIEPTINPILTNATTPSSFISPIFLIAFKGCCWIIQATILFKVATLFARDPKNKD